MIDFITVDPPGARDLDQALHIERRGDGHRVHYAIADVAHFVAPGSPADQQAWKQGVTYYYPDHQESLYPSIVEQASLLPGADKPAILWTLDLDARGALITVDVHREVVRSSAQHTYEDIPPDVLALMREVGERREALERERGGVSLPTPEQEVDPDGTLHYRAPVPSESWNAQLSLLTGMAAAELMLKGGIGLLRTLPPADPEALDRLRRVAGALGVTWDASTPYAEFIRSLDPFKDRDAAILHAAQAVLRGAAYVAFDGARPEQSGHSALAEEYAHVTAPLRRLADRYTTECALAAFAGTPVPDWARSKLPDLPAVMLGADKHEAELERAAVDHAESLALAGHEGETFEAVAVDDEHVQLRDPAVRARCDGEPPVGQTVRVKLDTVDPVVRFSFSPSA